MIPLRDQFVSISIKFHLKINIFKSIPKRSICPWTAIFWISIFFKLRPPGMDWYLSLDNILKAFLGLFYYFTEVFNELYFSFNRK